MEARGPDSGAVNPYAPPTASIDTVPPPLSLGAGYTFKSTNGLAKLIAVLLGLEALTKLASGVNALVTLSVIGSATAWDQMDRAALEGINQRALVLQPVASVLVIGTMVLFCVFMVRANRNARAFGAPMTVTPGWAAGWFFIPVAALWKPYYAMKEIWQGSGPDPSVPFERAGVSSLLAWWWWMWLLRNVGSQVYRHLAKRIETPTDLNAASLANIVFLLPSAGAALLAAAVVVALARRQDARARRLAAPPAVAVP
jgi:hypothetical protein